MSLRLKSLVAAFGISISLWAALIQGAIALSPVGIPDLDLNHTASIPAKGPTAVN